MEGNEERDVIVVGAGPAGAMTANTQFTDQTAV